MKLRNSPVVVVLLLALIALSSSSAFARPAGQSGSDPSAPPGATPEPQRGTVTRNISEGRQRVALRYWSRERLAAAAPLEVTVQSEVMAADAAAAEDPAAAGPAVTVAAGNADADAIAVAQAAYPEDWAVLAENPAGAMASAAFADEPAGTSQIYTSYVANLLSSMQTIYPHTWIGRISFLTPSGSSFCSATVLRNNTIVTAAHCVFDSTSNRWYTNVVFSPAYRLGSAPFGTFPASACTIPGAYVNLTGSYTVNGWARHDVAVCSLRSNSAGRTINQAVGWAGYQVNQPIVRHFHTMGYPFRDYRSTVLPDAGAYLRACVGESYLQTTETRGMGCSWGGGISGGPWFVGYAPGAISGAVDGVNSGLFVGAQNMFGPRFNSSNFVPLCSARGC